MLNKKVSIIMPAFNTSKFIGKAIQSVLNQTYNHFELIIIDDKSTDNTINEINSFKDSRIVFLRNEINLGVGETRNKAIEIATGDYLAFMDSDDIWVNYKLSRQIEFMELKSVIFSFHPLIFIDEIGKEIGKPLLKNTVVDFQFLLGNTIIPTSSIIIDKTKFNDVYFPKVKYRSGEDYAFVLKLLKQTKFAYGINEFLGFYRKTNTSLSSKRIFNIKKVFFVQRTLFKISLLQAFLNSGLYAFNAFLKHFFHNKI